MRNNIRSFKNIFAVVMALALGSLGIALGLGIKAAMQNADLSPNNPLSAFKDSFVMSNHAVLAGLCAIGLLSGVLIGPKCAQGLVNAGNAIEGMSSRDKFALSIGSFVGVLISLPFFLVLSSRPNIIGTPLAILLAVAFVYLGIRATMSMKDEFRFIGTPVAESHAETTPTANCKILDTNVIIDGRVAEVCRTGFIEGPLYVPGFVLDELQHIADSSDSLKRARGRRGLDILNAMQKELPLIVRSWDGALDRSARNDEVDTRLVKLAKALEGVIVTNDFNLNKVAALQGVQVLNINELANVLKPVVLPGEIMTVGIVKEGKEPHQGVAYLDDGTMIVVEDGRRFIGSTMPVVVTTVLQTVAGKMIFARTRDGEGEGFDAEENRGERDGRDYRERGDNGQPGNGNGHGTGYAPNGGRTPRSRPGGKVR